MKLSTRRSLGRTYLRAESERFRQETESRFSEEKKKSQMQKRQEESDAEETRTIRGEGDTYTIQCTRRSEMTKRKAPTSAKGKWAGPETKSRCSALPAASSISEMPVQYSSPNTNSTAGAVRSIK
jgi:hypothetical protein